MALIDDLSRVLARLARRGWAELFRMHGLDITVGKATLAAELDRPLRKINRKHPGFEEFALNGVRGVEPGSPSRSLLYHGLASADVRPLKQGKLTAADFPTLDDLDTIENFIYSLAKRSLASFENPVLAVFAYQYRSKALSPHRRHADLAFSRTGVSRVGTEAYRYDPSTRAFDPRPGKDDRGFAALPARYATFIAEYRSPTAGDSVLRQVPNVDQKTPFLFPVHKLFAGDECLWRDDATPLVIPHIAYAEFHINEKLRRIHRLAPDNPGRVKPLPQFDIDEPPFVRTSANSADLVRLVTTGASCLIAPVPNPLVRTATQRVEGKQELVRFKVPKGSEESRFWSSLMLPATDAGRAAPEYANIRQEVVAGAGKKALRNLNQVPDNGTPAKERFDAKVSAGGYEAAHFIDSTCDGAVSVKKPAGLELPVLPAYSLVTAVDYFPLVDQVEIEEWVEQQQGRGIGLSRPGIQFQHPVSGPKPLSDGRFVGIPERNPNRLEATKRIPNPQIPEPSAPGSGAFAFSETEKANHTATAIVGRASGAGSLGESANPAHPTSWLPDAASDVFAPGWDISQHSVDSQSFYASYGLGSPFPEDSKLCAALNSFWPAVAPDSSRTFGFWPGADRLLSTAIPLLDGELGYHPGHPRVVAGEVASARGWDGEHGPFLTPQNGTMFVDAADPNRSDQTRSALDGDVGFSGLDRVDAAALITRMEDLAFCRSLLDKAGMGGSPWLVSVEKVDNWATWRSVVRPRASATLKGTGYIFIFAQVDPLSVQLFGDPPLRRRFPVQKTVEVQLSAARALWRVDGSGFQTVDR